MDMRLVFVTWCPLLYWGAGKGSLSLGQRISVYGVFWSARVANPLWKPFPSCRPVTRRRSEAHTFQIPPSYRHAPRLKTCEVGTGPTANDLLGAGV